MGLPDSLGLFFYERIQPALEKAFDQYGYSKQTLVIDRLEFDCGNIPTEDWETVFLQRILQQVGEELNSSKKNNHESISIEAKAAEVFFLFLQKGHFPWNSPFSTPKDLEKAIVFDRAFLESLKNIFRRSSVISERLFKSFSPEFISKIFESISQKSNPRIGALVKSLQSQPRIQRELMQGLLITFQYQNPTSISSVLRTLISNFSIENLPYLAEYLSREMVREKQISEGLRSLFSETTPAENRRKILLVMEIMLKRDPSILKKIGISKAEIDSDNEDRVRNKVARKSSLPEKSEVPENLIPSLKEVNQNGQSDSETSDEIFIENAGLVLLNPFLESLFDNLHLVKNRNFVGKAEQFLAAKILEYLVFGENEHSENYFPLNKILCGIELTQVLDLEKELTRNSKIECEEMMQELIRHWSVLKNTSVGGLRETFLQRNGKLTRVEKGWKLQVERKSVDVLLAKLPWGIGIIKLPWMTEMIFVEWD